MPEQLSEEMVASALMKMLSKAAGEGDSERQKHDLPAGFTITTNLLHGATGIFGAAGVDRNILSTRIRPTGLSAIIPARPSPDTHPIVGYLTGFTDDEDGDEKEEECDEPLEAGSLKSCFQGSAFGRIERKTQVLEMNALGTRVNRGEFNDLMLVNEPLLTGDFGTPSVPGTFGAAFASEVNARLMTLGVAFQNKIGVMNWTGSVLNNTSGGYAEYTGLESLITTTHTDVLTGANCPSLASDVKDANYKTIENDSADIFSYMTMMYRYVKRNAVGMGFMPVDWRWVMRGDAFQQLVDYWPCTYATYRCAGSAGNPNGTDAMAMRQISNDMANGQYLMIDNVRVPVIIDDFIPEDSPTNNANVPEGSWASDIYLLPFSVRGNFPVLFYEYFNYQGANAALQAVRDGQLSNFWTSDDGRFLWTTHQTLWCVAWYAKLEPRLRLLAPHLAGRLQNVMYSPLQHFRDPDPDSPYFVDGGNETGDWDPYYSQD